MNNTSQLETEERELLDSYERDEGQSVSALPDRLRQYQAYATAALEAAGLVSIPLSKEDLWVIRRKAAEAGVSYQTLIADIVHQYVTGHLVEKPRGASSALASRPLFPASHWREIFQSTGYAGVMSPRWWNGIPLQTVASRLLHRNLRRRG